MSHPLIRECGSNGADSNIASGKKKMTVATSGAENTAFDCEFCGLKVPFNRKSCPHCARPQWFPNVRLAGQLDEVSALDARYDDAFNRARTRNSGSKLALFDEAAARSAVVFNCWEERLSRLMGAGTAIYETYYDLEALRLRHERPSGPDWQRLRPQAEVELMGDDSNKDQLHYAALSINGKGVARYGNCSIQLREPMISHRASCFEGNTAVLFDQRRRFEKGMRSTWERRNRLCVSKVADSVHSTTDQTEFAGLLLKDGASDSDGADDEFVEVHIFGSITMKTFAQVSFDSTPGTELERVLRAAIREKLQGESVDVIERSVR